MDATLAYGHLGHMTIEIAPRIQVLLTRIDPARNMSRYYVLAVAPDLFGDSVLTREWGRLGAPRGQSRQSGFEKTEAALESLSHWLRRKQAKGYVARSS